MRTRRRWLRAAGTLVALAAIPGRGLARLAEPREIAFRHLHTGETLRVVYSENGGYVTEALAAIDRLLRDFRTDEIHPIDPALLDALHATGRACGSIAPFEVISGYRSPSTNESLRQQGEGVALRSMHLLGRAIDVRVAGVSTRQLRDAAIGLRLGGVGYYAESDFVHLDTGRVRSW